MRVRRRRVMTLENAVRVFAGTM
ncbi:rhodanese, partial [Vibrio parahaemolyticus]